MNFSKFFSRQARKPSGLFGRLISSQIFEKGNAELNDLMFEALGRCDDERILEIGFGPGKLIQEIADRSDPAMIEGIDFSKPMLDIAAKKNRIHIQNGKVRLHLGDFDTAPFDGKGFDKIFTVNTVYFWKNPESTVSRISGLLRPGGRIFIGLHEKKEMEKLPLDRDVFQYYSMEELKELLWVHGSFTDIEIRSKPGKKRISYCAVGTRPEA
ncbi:class I SAM-dependent methyltransferase [Desulfospira joergensenii]|uniref:class I SAM-dependent methyltransferase n=1 Tax=Desulfospira joergensenii TaxID=53329 RepID=UPI0003B745BE|nr:class I SAM-dependent methyltransferase [Desulfospira joergensenii]